MSQQTFISPVSYKTYEESSSATGRRWGVGTQSPRNGPVDENFPPPEEARIKVNQGRADTLLEDAGSQEDLG